MQLTTKPEQHIHWNKVFQDNPAFFGEHASALARRAVELLRQANVRTILELGCGQGRDTLLFAAAGFAVTAVDYAETAVDAVRGKIAQADVPGSVTARRHDVKMPLPEEDNTFDACFSHMLLCMELSTEEMRFLMRETHRVLKPGGVVVYSVRSKYDKHYRQGNHLGEEIYDIGGFVIHFFDEAKIRNLAAGFDIVEIDRMEEGSLPRDLFVVTLRKKDGPVDWDAEYKDTEQMNDAMQKFQEFLEASLAPGALDHKTKQMVALGAALAAGCDT